VLSCTRPGSTGQVGVEREPAECGRALREGLRAGDRGYVTVEPEPTVAPSSSPSPDRGREAAELGRTMLARVQRLWDERLGPDDAATLNGLLARVAGVAAETS
jgi:hypothetical protein